MKSGIKSNGIHKQPVAKARSNFAERGDAFILQHALVNDQFVLKQANNLFASLKRHTRRPLNPRQHPRKNSAKNKNSRYRSKVPTQESDDALGKRPTKAKVLVVHRIGSSALTAQP
jgi:hypothetical protein